MATRYWVGGSGTWDSSSTTHWSATSGGAAGASAPTSADDVIFNSASSGASYIVTCNVGQCKSITTAAPLAGTLTFTTDPSTDLAMQVQGGDINIHAACLFTNHPNYYDIVIQQYATGPVRTYTATFNGSGTNTSKVIYSFVGQNSIADSLNFCLSQTCTFMDVYVNNISGAFACTGSSITVTGYPSGDASFAVAGSPTSVTMTTTTVTLAPIASVLGVTMSLPDTATFSLATLNIVVGTATTNNVSGNINIGASSSSTPPIGNLTINTGSAFSVAVNANVNNLTNLSVGSNGTLYLYPRNYGTSATVSGTTTLAGGYLVVDGNWTFTGTITGTVSNLIAPTLSVNTGYTVTCNGTVTMTGASGPSYVPVIAATGATVTFNGAVTFNVNGTLSAGTVAANAGITFAPTGTEYCSLACTTAFTANSFTSTNTKVDCASINVTGGVGKSFSYTLNSSSPTYDSSGVRVTMNFNSATINVPTISIVGDVTRRVVVNAPLTEGATFRTMSISGATPTLTNVSFFGTTINSGASAYTGTRLGTDGLSTGFVPTAASNKYAVVGTSATVQFESAIWALTSGGATSANNCPLPQDTIYFDANSGAGSGGSVYVYCDNDVYVAGIIATNPSLYTTYLSQTTVGNVPYLYVFDSLYTNMPSGQQISLGRVRMYRSSTSDRYVQVYRNSNMYLKYLQLDAGNSTTVTLLPVDSSATALLVDSAEFYSGTVNMVGTVNFNSTFSPGFIFQVGDSTSKVITLNLVGAAPTINTRAFDIGTNGVITSNNYSVYIAAGFWGGSVYYRNLNVGSAKNGNFAYGTGLSFIYANSTSATNPLRGITFITSSIQIQGSLYVQNVTTAATSITGTGTTPTIIKTNGGTVNFPSGTTVNNLRASPSNTFYAASPSTLIGTTTGWTIGSATTPNSGFFFF